MGDEAARQSITTPWGVVEVVGPESALDFLARADRARMRFGPVLPLGNGEEEAVALVVTASPYLVDGDLVVNARTGERLRVSKEDGDEKGDGATLCDGEGDVAAVERLAREAAWVPGDSKVDGFDWLVERVAGLERRMDAAERMVGGGLAEAMRESDSTLCDREDAEAREARKAEDSLGARLHHLEPDAAPEFSSPRQTFDAADVEWPAATGAGASIVIDREHSVLSLREYVADDSGNFAAAVELQANEHRYTLIVTIDGRGHRYSVQRSDGDREHIIAAGGL